MAYTKYSLTPANNTAAPPDGAPEGMLPSAVNDTMRDMMAQIRDVGDGVRDGTYTMTAVKITGGTINGATIGATTATTGKFTTLTNSALTSGRVTYAGASGLLADSAGLTYNGAILTISSGASASALTATSTSSGGTALNIQNSGTVNALIGGYLSCIGSGSASDVAVAAYQGALAFATNGANERMRIDTSGNVGIGTTTPTATLDVTSATVGYMNLTGGAGAGQGSLIRFRKSTTDIGYLGTSSAILGDSSSNFLMNADGARNLVFWVNGSERMRLDTSGNLLVGTTTSGITTAGIYLKPEGNVANIPLISSTGASSSDTQITYTVYSTTAAAYRFYVGYGGTIFATSIVITAISDQRLKENIRDIDTGLDAIMALKPRRFDWKEGKGQDKKDVAGFIAQEFEDVFPECVSTSKAGADGIEYKNINHETLIPTLVKAIQEQQALIESLTTRLTALENK
jgi:hypothetical protein